jgi:hypothetical protein
MQVPLPQAVILDTGGATADPITIRILGLPWKRNGT